MANGHFEQSGLDETIRAARAPHAAPPELAALLADPAALDLLMAAQYRTRKAGGEWQTALTGLNAAVDLPGLTLSELAALALLNLNAFLLTRDGKWESAGRRALAQAAARYDERQERFTAGPPAADRADVAANSKLAEVFYLGWRVWRDAALRPIAGDVLGQVGDAFDPVRGLPASFEVPAGQMREPRPAATYAAAIRLFLTATETTARGTYVIRARILADDLLSHPADVSIAPDAAKLAWAEALVRLAQFTGEASYLRQARSLLERRANALPGQAECAAFELAAANARTFPLRVIVVGNVEHDPVANELYSAALETYAPARAIEALDPVRHAARLANLNFQGSPPAAIVIKDGLPLPLLHSTPEWQQALGEWQGGTSST